MKCFRSVALILFLIADVAGSIQAQVPAPSTAPPPAAQPPPSDPFIRNPATVKPATVGKTDEAATPSINLLTLVETWSLAEEDFVKILDEKTDEGALYDRLEELAKTGKAKLLGLVAVSSKSGQRAVIELIDEVRYPTEFDTPQRGAEITFPTAWETRNTGDTFEVESVLGADGQRIDVNLVPQTVRFEGFRDWQAEAGAPKVAQPHFKTEKVTTSVTLQSGRPAFLATATPAAIAQGGDGQIRIRALRVTAQPVAPAPVGHDEGVAARVEFFLYSVPRETARRILTESADSIQSHAAARALVEKGEAQVEVVSSFVTKSGQRGVNEEIFEFRYPSQMHAPSFERSTAGDVRHPPTVSSFETRNIGFTIEIEPLFVSNSRLIEINVVPRLVRFAGMLIATGGAAKYPSSPVFTTRQVTTSVSSSAGAPVLLGTLSQPRDSGVNDRKDDGRTGLAYLRVTPVSP